jgi:regulator of sirC expression with transglutaminase-like and TPR domain
VLQAAQQFAALTNYTGLEFSLERLTQLTPTMPEAWYDSAALKAALGKSAEALRALRRAVDLSDQRLKGDAKARDLRAEATRDSRFAPIRQLPEFRQLTAPR